jgi:hypothetical protein
MARNFLTPINLNKLELQNAAIQNLATDPESPVAGQVYYNTVINKIKVYSGSSWAEVGNSQEQIEDFIAGLIVAGNGISENYNDESGTLTISNAGVTSLLGTTNEVNVSASAGSVTVGLPDDVTIAGDLSVDGYLNYNNLNTASAASATYSDLKNSPDGYLLADVGGNEIKIPYYYTEN